MTTTMQIPSYSGVTINITNPTVNAGANGACAIQPPVIQTQQTTSPVQAYPPEYYMNNYNTNTSKEIIENIDSKAQEQKELEKNGKQTRVIALTNEYIMSLENYLNNPNKDIRIMASKEILTRLDEDKTRFDDAALNALLNKMLQDPEKLVRVAALSAFSSGLASGNDYTVQLLNKIQQDPKSDQQDVIDAANILLKMSADTEVKYTPAEPKPQEAAKQ